MNETSEILAFFGRLHTVVLHLPIGILVLAFLLEICSRFSSFEKLNPLIPFVLFCGMIAAILTAIFGYLLSQETAYDQDLLWNHKWLGISTAGASILLYFFRKNKTIYLLSFIGLMVLLISAGHTGGSITHGENFLTEPFEEKKQAARFVGNIEDVKVFQQLIQPIFKSKCNSCHNAGKIKGGLILSDTASIKKGGDNGPLYIAGQVKSSLLLERIDLPIELEEHMPPKGKKQLSKEEITLLRWWISGKGEFVETVKAYPTDPTIEQLLKDRFIKKETGIATLDIDPVSTNKINTVLNKGLKIIPMGSNSPWIEARLSNRKNLNSADFKSLKKIAKNLTVLDLGETPLDDELISNINTFPNLSKLFLDQTLITDQGLKKIKPLKYLEYLNLYRCDISDESIEHLQNFKNLKALYLWQTKITSAGIEQLKTSFPDLQIINGSENQALFASAKLRAPKIKTDSILFKDELLVTLDLNFPWAKIYYTLDGSDPDSSSLLYKEPITITKSTVFKTFAAAQDWESSDVAEASFLSIKNRPRSITINNKANEKYQANGKQSLVDFKLGSDNFSDGQWLGWQGESVTAILDFEKEADFSTLFVSCLDNNASWIFFPKQLKISTSSDGKKYTEVASKTILEPTSQQAPSLKKLNLSFEKTKARYVKIHIESRTKNPAWHPAAGKPSWLFIDEIVVE